MISTAYSEEILETAFVPFGAHIAAAQSTAPRRSRFDDIFARHRRQRLQALIMLVSATIVCGVLFAV
jgi:hypothetical protein